MAQRKPRATSSKDAPPPKQTPPERLTRRQIAHEFGRIGDKYTVAEMSRRTTIPQSTLRSWIKKGQISKRGLERSRRALPIARKIRRAVTPSEIRKRAERKRERQAGAVHFAFATGINPILTATKLKQPSFDKISSAIAHGEALPRSPTITTKKFDAILDACYAEYAARNGDAENDGFDYRRAFEPIAESGQAELSQAWLDGLRWVFERDQIGIAIVPYSDEILEDYDQRRTGAFFTENATAMWQCRNYCLPLPPGYFIVTFESVDGEITFEVKVWAKKDIKGKRRKRTSTTTPTASQAKLPGV